MSSNAQFIVALGLATILSAACGDSSGDAPGEGEKKVTFYLKGMGKKLKLL